MTDRETALRELLAEGSDTNLLRDMIAFAAERLMELEVGAATGAARGERSPERRVQRRYHDAPSGPVAASGGEHGTGSGHGRHGDGGLGCDRVE